MSLREENRTAVVFSEKCTGGQDFDLSLPARRHKIRRRFIAPLVGQLWAETKPLCIDIYCTLVREICFVVNFYSCRL